MANLIALGFETGDLLEAFATSGSISVQSTTVNSGVYALQFNPTTTGVGYYEVGGVGATGSFSSSIISSATLFFSGYFRYSIKPTLNDEEIFVCRTTGTTADKFCLRLNSSGNLAAYDSTGTNLLATGTTVLAQDTWYWIDVKIGTSATVGAWEVRINGVSEISGTANLTATNGGTVRLGKATNRNGATSLAITGYWDDVALDSAAYPGVQRTWLLVPNGAGNYQTGTATGAATHWQAVNEVPSDGNTSYVLSDNVSGDAESEACTNTGPAGITGTVNHVRSIIVSAKNGASNGTITVGMRSASTDVYRGSAAGPTGTYIARGQLQTTDPATTVAWTLSGIDGAEPLWKESQAAGNTSRATFMGLMVNFVPAAVPVRARPPMRPFRLFATPLFAGMVTLLRLPFVFLNNGKRAAAPVVSQSPRPAFSGSFQQVRPPFHLNVTNNIPAAPVIKQAIQKVFSGFALRLSLPPRAAAAPVAKIAPPVAVQIPRFNLFAGSFQPIRLPRFTTVTPPAVFHQTPPQRVRPFLRGVYMGMMPLPLMVPAPVIAKTPPPPKVFGLPSPQFQGQTVQMRLPIRQVVAPNTGRGVRPPTVASLPVPRFQGSALRIRHNTGQVIIPPAVYHQTPPQRIRPFLRGVYMGQMPLPLRVIAAPVVQRALAPRIVIVPSPVFQGRALRIVPPGGRATNPNTGRGVKPPTFAGLIVPRFGGSFQPIRLSRFTTVTPPAPPVPVYLGVPRQRIQPFRRGVHAGMMPLPFRKIPPTLGILHIMQGHGLPVPRFEGSTVRLTLPTRVFVQGFVLLANTRPEPTITDQRGSGEITNTRLEN